MAKAMNKTEQCLNIWMARAGIRGITELARRTGFNQSRLSQAKKDLGGLPARSLLVLADYLKLSDEEVGQLLRSQRG